MDAEKKSKKVKQKKKEDYFNENGKDKNVFAYARVSTTSQQIGNQFEEIAKYCTENDYDPPEKNIYYDSGVSGGVSWLERRTKQLFDIIPDKAILIVCEISRLGRNAVEVMELLSCLFRKEVTIHDIKNDLVFNNFDNDMIMMKVFCLSMFTQVEKNTIKKRIKNAVNNEINKKSNKLDPHKDKINQWKIDGLNANQITNKLKEEGLDINKAQVYQYFKNK